MLLFKELKQNYPVYILDKQNMEFRQGTVRSVSFPHMDMNYRATASGNVQSVVDVTIELEGKQATYTMSDNVSVTYTDTFILATEKDSIIREVEAMRSTSQQVLDSVEHHRKVIDNAQKLLAELNPVFKEKKETEERFTKIEGSISEIKDLIHGLVKELKG